MSQWSTADIPDLTGRVAIVTGANSGIGFVTALELSRHGSTVTIAGRSPGRDRAAAERIRAQVPDARIEVAALDLADLASVRTFADEFAASHDRLDLLVNNAGVAFVPHGRTVDGFETHLGINHFGHFALTGRLLPLLLSTEEARVVTVSSEVHEGSSARLNFDDLGFDDRYSRFTAYARSKLANLLFTQELQRRSAAAGSSLRALATNPSLTRSNLGPRVPGRRIVLALLRPFMNPTEVGAAPTLYAATAPDLEGGEYVQPDGRNGPPVVRRAAPWAYDEEAAGRLWETSESLTQVSFGLKNRARSQE